MLFVGADIASSLDRLIVLIVVEVVPLAMLFTKNISLWLGHEIESWKRFMDEAYGEFLAGGFSEVYQEKINHEFKALLPGTPPWK